MARTILITEDDPALQQLLITVAKQLKLDYQAVSDGQAAVDLIEKQSFDLILLDIIMPKLNGLDVLRKLRISGNQTPVIVLSNLDNKEDMETASQFGAMQYIVKSNVSLKDIRVAVEEALTI